MSLRVCNSDCCCLHLVLAWFSRVIVSLRFAVLKTIINNFLGLFLECIAFFFLHLELLDGVSNVACALRDKQNNIRHLVIEIYVNVMVFSPNFCTLY